ncbi:unnamed protein product [Rangifer tarandus platyrhynchus]|uniref:Uncharacterized protein n=1 Tax=Rangifer tarandus platyrhynchus TaxID=3082113 RepID=A0AC59Z7G3_RANTA
MQSDVANERNWTATQRNQLFAELGAARGFQRLKVSSPGWKMRGRGVGGKAWEPVAARLRAGAHGGSQLARRPGARGRSVPREVPATPPPPPPAPSPAASSLSPSPFPHVWVTSKFREKAAWWLLQRRRDSAAQRAPPGRRGRGGRSSEPAGSLSPEAGPADAAGQTPPAPNLSGKARSPGSSSAPGRAAGERRAPPDSVPAVSRRRGAAAGKGQPCEVPEAPSHLVFLGLAGGVGGALPTAHPYPLTLCPRALQFLTCRSSSCTFF